MGYKTILQGNNVDLLSILEKIKNLPTAPTASIFVTGLSETDVVTATKGGVTKNGVWVSRPNPAAHGLPDGYTELEYIESSGTQYVDTEPLGGLNAGWLLEADMRIMSVGSGYQLIFGAQTTTVGANPSWFGTYDSNWTIAGGVLTQGSAASIGSDIHVEATTCKDVNRIYEDGVSKAEYGSSTDRSGLTPYLFCINDGGTPNYFSSVRFYGLINIYSDSEKTNLVRSYCPAKRNSDNAIGLYDFVLGEFCANAGTGEFIAGEEVSEYTYGHEISKLDLGTWTVTATDGEDTITQDVLVDAITEYEIEMDYATYLYNLGDECEDITGGWQAVALKFNNNTSAAAPTVTRNDDNIVGYMGTAGMGGILRCANTIDLTDIDKLYFTGVFTYGKNMRPAYLKLCVWSALSSYADANIVAYLSGGDISEGANEQYSVETAISFNDEEIDVSALTGNHIIGFIYYAQNGSNSGEFVRSTMRVLKMR